MLVIGLDAGHGGSDPGACHNGIVEAEWAMTFARLVASRIRMAGEPFDPVMLRRNDEESLSLLDRGERSHAFGCDFVLSFHVNAATNKRLHGCLCFREPGNDIGREVGDVIMRSWPKGLHKPGWTSFAATDIPGKDDDWLQKPHNVIEVHGDIPTVLVEVGYCSYQKDAEYLKDLATQCAMVPAILAGLGRLRQMKGI